MRLMAVPAFAELLAISKYAIKSLPTEVVKSCASPTNDAGIP